MNLTTLLAILQQGEYNFSRFEKWYQQHASQDLVIEPEKWTPKLKLIKSIVQSLGFLPLMTRFKVALLITQPGENAIRKATYLKAQQKLARLRQKGLVVVAIAGSYGKTSTKHILQHTLGQQVPTLMTPKSINTMLGISQIIQEDLHDTHKVFVCELGEFNPGDLAELVAFLQPDYGILTPIGHQHLELLGSFENVVAEFEGFLSYFTNTPDKVIVAEENLQYLSKALSSIKVYGKTSSAKLRSIDATVNRAGTEFNVLTAPSAEPLAVFMPLYGEHQASNTLPSFWLAEQLQLDPKKIATSLAAIPYIERRHQPTFAENNILILDNSYNTNPDSVRESLKLLGQLQPTRKIIITAGFVEQGTDSEKTHEAFGAQLAKSVDYVGIFSQAHLAAITKGFTAAGGEASHLISAKTQEAVVQQLQPYIIPGSVLLFEGGYQEIHG